MYAKFKSGFVVRVLLFLVTAAVSGGNLLAGETMKVRIDRLAQPYVDAKIVDGMTVGVVQRGESAVVGYGRLSETDNRQPDGDTVYEIGSMSKVFTGALLGDAVARGAVRLDQPVAELLPDGVTMPERGERPITLEDLATHVSGLPRLPSNLRITNPANPYARYSVKQMYAFLKNHRLSRAPGEKIEYSNLGAGLLGHVLALKSDTSYEALLRERIAIPLGMDDTVITLSKDQRARLAPPHQSDGRPAKNWDIPTFAGAGAIRSTASDMLRFIAANLKPPAGELGTAIETAWKIHQPPLATEDFAMGLGWHVARDGHTRWHNGGTGGYHAMMLVDRRSDAGVVVLANTSTGEVDTLAQDIIRMLMGMTVEPRAFEKPAEIDVAPETMQRYVGKYQLVPGFVLSVSLDGERLMVGATGQSTFQVFPRSETEWFYKVVEAALTFHVDADGNCDSVVLFQNGVRQTAKRME
jgi:CubicO group peptidase (beta-lactamase class C family)